MAFSSGNGKKDAEFNVSLLEIANEITHDQLEAMKFLCQNDLPIGKLDSIKKPREFLNFLRKTGKIGPDDVTYLVSLLEDIGNILLANAVRRDLGKI